MQLTLEFLYKFLYIYKRDDDDDDDEVMADGVVEVNK